MKKKKGFDPLWTLQAAAYYHAGIKKEDIAQALGITLREMQIFCRRYPAFGRAVDSGKLDDPVEEALLRRAIGFRQTETVEEDIVDKNTGTVTENCKKRTVTKEIAPDVRALLFWLKNRRPDRWKERNGNQDGDGDVDFDELDESL